MATYEIKWNKAPKNKYDKKAKEENTVALANFLLNKGLTPTAVYGILGNLFVESGKGYGVNPYAYNSDDKGGPSGGIAQWHDRGGRGNLTDLKSFASKRGTRWDDIETQAEFLWYSITEGNLKSREIVKALNNASSISEAAFIWGNKYERFQFYDEPNGRGKNNYKKRSDYANVAKNLYTNYTGSPVESDITNNPQSQNPQIQQQPENSLVLQNQENQDNSTNLENNSSLIQSQNNYYTDELDYTIMPQDNYSDKYSFNDLPNIEVTSPRLKNYSDKSRQIMKVLNKTFRYQSGGSISNDDWINKYVIPSKKNKQSSDSSNYIFDYFKDAQYGSLMPHTEEPLDYGDIILQTFLGSNIKSTAAILNQITHDQTVGGISSGKSSEEVQQRRQQSSRTEQVQNNQGGSENPQDNQSVQNNQRSQQAERGVEPSRSQSTVDKDSENYYQPDKWQRRQSNQDKTTHHIVQEGEDFADIAEHYDMKQDDLMELNNLKSTQVRPGQVLTVKKNNTVTD